MIKNVDFRSKTPVFRSKTGGFLFYSVYTEYIASKSNLYFCEKIVPAQILIEYSITSLVCRTLCNTKAILTHHFKYLLVFFCYFKLSSKSSKSDLPNASQIYSQKCQIFGKSIIEFKPIRWRLVWFLYLFIKMFILSSSTKDVQNKKAWKL